MNGAAAAGAPPLDGRVRLEGRSAVLYVEPKGHGVYAYDGGEKQTPSRGTLVYRFAARADDPEAAGGGAAAFKDSAGYELVPLFDTLWPRARAGAKETFGAFADYGAVSFASLSGGGNPRRLTKKIGRLGADFSTAYLHAPFLGVTRP